jgi:hypothetical protein
MLTDLEAKKRKINESGMKRKREDESSSIDNLESNRDNDNDDETKPPARGDMNDNISSSNDAADTTGEQLVMTKKGKIGFAAMAQAIAAKWKLIDEKSLAHYRDIASEDMKRYRKEMEEYEQDGVSGGGRGGKSNEDDDG